MPFGSIKAAKSRRFPVKINDISLTLGQINILSDMFDAIKAEGDTKEPMAVSISTFKKQFKVEAGRFVKKKKDAKGDFLDMPDQTGFDIVKFQGKFRVVNRDPWELVITVATEEEARAKVKEFEAEAKKAIKSDDNKVLRFDFARIRDKHIDGNTGFLTTTAIATRTGIFVYRKADGGIFKELRTDEEVFKKDSMDSLKNKPLTNGHPQQMVGLDNASRLMVGHTSSRSEKVGDLLETDITITNKEVIEQVDSGKKFLSCGYWCELDHTPGVFKGEKYDAIQKNISYNHVAIVSNPRAGDQAQLHLDDADAVMVIDLDTLDDNKNPSGGTGSMKKIKIDGKEYEVTDEVFAAFEKAGKLQKETKDSLDKEVTDHKATKDEKEKLQAKHDASEKENKELKEKKDAQPDKEQQKKDVNERISVLEVGKKVCDEEAQKKFDEMDNIEIKKAVLTADDKDLDLKEKTDEYINARFDIIKETLEKTDGTDRLGGSILKNRQDGKIPDTTKAREDSMKTDGESWKQPCSATSQKS